ncbi:DNA polymerase I [Granulicatella sp. zg-ZJ]|uniref:DNA polymerase I n=1 Tax=Granulicatella sp. zg-ZJ TaxID=2678504 RepID=UPI0013D694CA|nr:DNA polymerase I [Granulicatella sp. zg-ZJ]NEW62242.1 DNA polymerase I [Granulicatella sp. zg-ZJ]
MSKNKLLLIDGSSLAFRAFYGLSYLDKFKTKTGLHTNALYAFHTMLDSMMKREEATHILVAFDAGKTTFRTEMFTEYKGGRDKMPEEMAEQWPYFRVMLDALGIKHYELLNYEADDIIGTLASMGEQENFEVVVVSGDRDLIQLTSEHIRVDITKKGSEVYAYTPQVVMNDMGITPKQLIDVKGLMGDSSDNYPGVTKVGEKTALKLIQEYGSVEGVYDHVQDMKTSKLKENLIADKENAFLSKNLARILTDAPIDVTLGDTLYRGKNIPALEKFYKEMEFKQFLSQLDVQEEKIDIVDSAYEFVEEVTSDMVSQDGVFYIELLEENYHTGTPVGIAWSNQGRIYVSQWETLLASSLLQNWLMSSHPKIVFDRKKTEVLLRRYGLNIDCMAFDILLAAYLLNTNLTNSDISQVASEYYHTSVKSDEVVYGKGVKLAIPEPIIWQQHLAQKVDALQALYPIFDTLLKEQSLDALYYDMEMPLAHVLAQMECLGIKVNDTTLLDMKDILEERIVTLEQEIYDLVGEVFNINSPKKLGEILFEKLGLPASKKTKTGYSTAVDVLEKLLYVPIVEKILDYRQITKLKSTYVEGLLKYISDVDQKVHTRFVQTLTQTGRLSSTDPNLQNIPVRMEEGRRIRKAFVPSHPNWKLLSADYSQIELRVLAHIADDEHMKEAFVSDEDIHTSTAMRVFGVAREEVDDAMRRQAKAVNFGIVYGISDYGLSQNLNITRKAAKEFIDRYFEKYPNIQKYMHDIVALAKKQGYVETLNHRRRYLPDLSSSNFNIRSFAERTAMNTPIQGSAADIIKIAMIRMAREMEKRHVQSRMLLQVHDELIFEVPEEEIEIMQKLVKEVMENAVSLSVPLKVDCEIGDTWYDAK